MNSKVIKNLRTHPYYNEIKPLITEYNERQKEDYFLTDENISVGKLNFGQNKIFDIKLPKSPEGKKYNIKRKDGQHTSKNIIRNVLPLSSTSIEQIKQTNEEFKVNRNHYIDNISLKSYYNNIRKKIYNLKRMKKENINLLTQLPNVVRKSLEKQENIIKKANKRNKFYENLLGNMKKNNFNELLMNKSKNFNIKYSKNTIIDKNRTLNNKFKDNLWNVTLRNIPKNGTYEKIGFFNIGTKYNPSFTLFNINQKVEYFSDPNYNRINSEVNEENLISYLPKDKYNPKLKNNLHILNSINKIKLKGENLLNLEDNRETKTPCNKILLNKNEIDLLVSKQNDKSRNKGTIYNKDIKNILEEIYKEKIFVKNYTTPNNKKYKTINYTKK